MIIHANEGVHLLFCAHMIIFYSMFIIAELSHYNVYTTSGLLTLCNLLLQQFSSLFIQTLYEDSGHIDDVQLLCCAVLIYIFSYF